MQVDLNYFETYNRIHYAEITEYVRGVATPFSFAKDLKERITGAMFKGSHYQLNLKESIDEMKLQALRVREEANVCSQKRLREVDQKSDARERKADIRAEQGEQDVLLVLNNNLTHTPQNDVAMSWRKKNCTFSSKLFQKQRRKWFSIVCFVQYSLSRPIIAERAVVSVCSCQQKLTPTDKQQHCRCQDFFRYSMEGRQLQ
jgi:hypothetical protein